MLLKPHCTGSITSSRHPWAWKMRFACFLLRLRRIKRSQDISMGKFGAIALNFGYAFSINTFFGTPCSNGDQFCLMPKVLANLPGPKAFLHQSCASSSRTPASSLPGRMLLDVFLLLFVIDILIFVRSLKWRKKEQTWRPFAKIPSEMEIAPRYNSLHCWHCWHCWPCWNCWHCWSCWSCLHCWGARGADGADVAAIYILSHG